MGAPRLATLLRRGEKKKQQQPDEAQASAEIYEAVPGPTGGERDDDEGKETGGSGSGGGAPLVQSVSTRTENIVYPTGLRLALIMLSVFVSMFLVALASLHLLKGALERSPYGIASDLLTRTNTE